VSDPDRGLTDDQVNELYAALCGSCDSLETALEQQGFVLDDMTHEDHLELDDLMFLCDGCGWWCDALEMEGDQTCSDCS
jgi:hypothetical protein